MFRLPPIFTRTDTRVPYTTLFRSGPTGCGEEMGDYIILSAKGLTKEFRGFVALGGVYLSIARGTIHALIGPNGAGKTTCFNLLTKFLQPTAGSIVYKGQDITRLAPAEITRLGLARSFQISEIGRAHV